MRSYPGFQNQRFKTYFDNEIYLPYVNFIYLPITIFLAFVITDFIHFGDQCIMPIILRVVLAGMMAGAAYYCINHRPNVLQQLESVTLITSALFLVVVGRIAIGFGNYDYQGGVILVMIYIGTFSRLSARYSLITLTCILASYLIGLSPLLYAAEPAHELEIISIYLSTYVLVAAACLRRELEVHKRFSQSEQLRKQAIQLRKQSSLFEALSYQDALTGCYNRLYLHQVIEPNINRRQSMTTIMIDIDHFKSINDTYGHQTGDMVIKDIAHAIQAKLPQSSNLFRYGGEEFLIVSQGLDVKQAQQLADDLLSSPDAVTLDVTVSVGVKHIERAIGSVEQLIEDADRALYQSKKNGRNCISWCQVA